MKHSHTDNEQRPKNADLEAATIEVHRSLAALEEKLSLMAVSITDAGIPALSLDQLKNNIKVLQVNYFEMCLCNLIEILEENITVIGIFTYRLLDSSTLNLENI